MKLITSVLLFLLVCSCKQVEQTAPKIYKQVVVEDVFTDSLSIRAIELMGDGTLAFAANKGVFGLFLPKKNQMVTSKQLYDSIPLHFRAVAHTTNDFFMLSIESPALLYKTGENGKMKLVYEETGEGVFYDAMTFWNDTEGIAVGDSVNGCMSVIITRDGGETWNKIPCNELPPADAGEGAFAASNTNIKVLGNKAWVATTQGHIYYSEDKGNSWEVIGTPMQSKVATQGIYSVDFYDENRGFAIGGDYTRPEGNSANKMRTADGGKSWQLVADGQEPGYRSCVQYMPNTNAKHLVAVGFKGMDISYDSGSSWTHLNDESFYTIRFVNDSVAYAAGNNRISKLLFKE